MDRVKARLVTREQARARRIKSSPAHMYRFLELDLVQRLRHAGLGRLGRRDLEGAVGEAVGSTLLTRPSPPARAKTVQAEWVAAG